MPQFGDLVILASPRGKRHIYRLDPNQDIHTPDGVLRAADIVAAEFGTEVRTAKNVPPTPAQREAAVPQPSGTQGRQEREILAFAVRYPHAIGRLRDAGALLRLRSHIARALWEKLERTPHDEVFHTLDAREKAFWVHCRGDDAPPLNNETGEFAAVCAMLKKTQMAEQQFSAAAALRETGSNDFETDMELLRAIQASLEITNGKQH